VDLFTADEDALCVAVDHVTARLRTSGFEVGPTRRAGRFARVQRGHGRRRPTRSPPRRGLATRRTGPLAVGPALSLDDAVGSKICAPHNRGEVRDHLDVVRSGVRTEPGATGQPSGARPPSTSDGLPVRHLAARAGGRRADHRRPRDYHRRPGAPLHGTRRSMSRPMESSGGPRRIRRGLGADLAVHLPRARRMAGHGNDAR
jgi:hypothetical protein